MKTIILTGFILIISASSCRHVAFSKYAKDMRIVYGSGGGFTGATETYILKGNGSLYHIKAFSQDTVPVKTIDRKTLKKIFLCADSKKLRRTEFDKPGNMSSFIHLYRDGKAVKSWQWAKGAELPDELKELDNKLNKLH